jgi:apolipoprotein N-acyltransferase
VKRLRFLAEVACIALLGAAQTVAFVHTVALAAAAAGGRAPRLAGQRRLAPPGGLLGWAFGTAWLCAGTWWMYVSMHRYGGLPAGLAALAVFALCAFLSLYLAAAMAAVARWRRRRRCRRRRCSPAPGCSPSSPGA